MSGTVPFIIRRLLAAVPVLLAVSALTFFLGRFAPGDPVTVRTGGKLSPERTEEIRTSLGLNDPIPVQYVRYMGKFVRGDLGESYRRPGLKVSEIIFPKMWVSARVEAIPFVLTYLLGVPLGIYSALKRGRWQDPTITVLLLLLSAIPVIILIPLVVEVFARRLHWLPTSGWNGIFDKTNILPAIVLTIPGLAGIARAVRISMLQVMDEDFVRTAKAKGLREATIVSRHILRNSLLVIVNGVILSLFSLFAGSLFTETLLGIPGIGRETLDSIGSRDYDVFLALTMISAIAFIVANLALDLVYTVIDPRIRYT